MNDVSRPFLRRVSDAFSFFTQATDETTATTTTELPLVDRTIQEATVYYHGRNTRATSEEEEILCTGS